VVQPPVSPRTRHDLDSLTAVALEVFHERGYDATSMEQLAAAANLSKAAFYHHISGKEDLLARGLDRALSALFGVLDEPQATTGAALDRIRHVLRRVIELEDELLAEVTVLLRLRGNSQTERDALEKRRTFDRRVAELIATAQDEGSVRSNIDAHLSARLVIGTATSIVEWYRPGGKLAASRLADEVVALTFNGLTAQGEPQHRPSVSTKRS
jgi:AcrR family transcriptional regulator